MKWGYCILAITATFVPVHGFQSLWDDACLPKSPDSEYGCRQGYCWSACDIKKKGPKKKLEDHNMTAWCWTAKDLWDKHHWVIGGGDWIQCNDDSDCDPDTTPEKDISKDRLKFEGDRDPNMFHCGMNQYGRKCPTCGCGCEGERRE